jgi:multimeric flavodoxin WrbA
MPTLLVVHHTPSPTLHTLLEAVLAGAREVDGVQVEVRPALTASPVDVLESHGVVLGTPANLGYLSGAMKHFFDGCYYPCLGATRGRPYGLYLHGNDDVDGAARAAEKIVAGLEWKQVHDDVRVLGAPAREDTDACWDLGATVAARLVMDD